MILRTFQLMEQVIRRVGGLEALEAQAVLYEGVIPRAGGPSRVFRPALCMCRFPAAQTIVEQQNIQRDEIRGSHKRFCGAEELHTDDHQQDVVDDAE